MTLEHKRKINNERAIKRRHELKVRSICIASLRHAMRAGNKHGLAKLSGSSRFYACVRVCVRARLDSERERERERERVSERYNLHLNRIPAIAAGAGVTVSRNTGNHWRGRKGSLRERRDNRHKAMSH